MSKRVLYIGICLLTCAFIFGQRIVMSESTPPLEPEPAKNLLTWTDGELYAYSNGVIEGVWSVAGILWRNDNSQLAWQVLQVLGPYWWQISHENGIRGAMAYIRYLYRLNPNRFKDMALIELMFMEAKQLERIVQ